MWTKIVPLLGNWLSGDQLVPLAVMALAVLILMSSVRWRQHQRQRITRPEPPPDPPSKAVLRRDLDELLVELQELSRRISAEIDTRFAKLEAAMHDADRRIAVLNRLARQIGENQPSNGAVGDPRHTVIYELADAGFTPVEIARDLGKTPGEVELILNLRRRASS